MKTVIAAVAASLIAILPAAAQPGTDPAPAAAATPPAAAADSNGVVGRSPNTRYCYNTEATGTRINKRVCHTRAEWKERGIKVPERL